RSAPPTTSVQRGLVSFSRTIANCTAPAIIATRAHTALASRCRVGRGEKTTIAHRKTPPTRAIPGARYARQRRRPKTSVPTIASESRTSPKKRTTDAANQCAISAFGTIALLEILDEPGGDQEEVE